MDRRQRALLRAHRADQKRIAAARANERKEALRQERALVHQIEDAGHAFRKGWKKKNYQGATVKRLYAGMNRRGQIKYKEVVAFLVAAGPTTFPTSDGLEIRSYTSCYLLASGGWAAAHHGGGSSGDLSPVESFDSWLKRLRLGQSGPLNVAARSKIRREALARLLDANPTTNLPKPGAALRKAAAPEPAGSADPGPPTEPVSPTEPVPTWDPPTLTTTPFTPDPPATSNGNGRGVNGSADAAPAPSGANGHATNGHGAGDATTGEDSTSQDALDG